jgi:hypothetical protein
MIEREGPLQVFVRPLRTGGQHPGAEHHRVQPAGGGEDLVRHSGRLPQQRQIRPDHGMAGTAQR